MGGREGFVTETMQNLCLGGYGEHDCDFTDSVAVFTRSQRGTCCIGHVGHVHVLSLVLCSCMSVLKYTSSPSVPGPRKCPALEDGMER